MIIEPRIIGGRLSALVSEVNDLWKFRQGRVVATFVSFPPFTISTWRNATWRSDIAESAISILSWIVFGHSWCSTRVRIIEFRVTGRRFSKLASWAHASLSREITRVKSSRDRFSVFSSPVELAFRCSTDARTLGKRSRCCLRGDRSLSVLYGHVFETRVSFSVDFI